MRRSALCCAQQGGFTSLRSLLGFINLLGPLVMVFGVAAVARGERLELERGSSRVLGAAMLQRMRTRHRCVQSVRS